MSLEIIELSHVNVTVPQALEDATKHFYGVILGLEQLQKPERSRTNVGAWYQLGAVQLHLSIEDDIDNQASDRHVCYLVRNVAAAAVRAPSGSSHSSSWTKMRCRFISRRCSASMTAYFFDSIL